MPKKSILTAEMPPVRYAIVQDGVVVNVTLASEALADNWIACDDAAAIGDTHDGNAFTAPVAMRPELVITKLSSSDTKAIIGNGEITCTAGATITAEVKLQVAGNTVPLTEAFRMPLIARDGRERVLLVEMNKGKASINATITESGIWRISEDTINAALPPEAQMGFAGLTVYVLS